MMLPSDTRRDDLALAEEIGVSHNLTKPLKRSELYPVAAAVRDLSGTASQERAPFERSRATDNRPLRILLAEDSKDNRMLALAYLKNCPHHVDIAENGEMAVRKFVAETYDLVLMDMQMPVMDGYAATKAIRKWEIDQKVDPTPIIALTAYALKEEMQKSLDAGCTTHITKPIKKARLLDAILEYTRGVTA